MPSQYPDEFRDRAVRLVAESRPSHESEWAAIREVAAKLGVNSETLRKWVRVGQAQSGSRPGATREEQEEIRRLRKENAELRRANEILQSASAFFAARLDRTATR
jgi:transposase